MADSPKAVRARSAAVLRAAGIAIPASLPLNDAATAQRSAVDATERVLCLHVCASVAHGLSRASARNWIAAEALGPRLSPREVEFLASDGPVTSGVQIEFQTTAVESAWALLWALGFICEYDPLSNSTDMMLRGFPDLRVGEPARRFRERASLRSWEEIEKRRDLSYCVHWYVREMTLRRRQSLLGLPLFAARGRCLALDWLLCSDEWDEVPADT